MGKQIVVIGSGFGGLAVAVRLAARGHDVTVVEKRDQPGGRAYVYRRDGFTFDGGPTVITAPWLITELFELAGRAVEDYVTLVPVDPFYRIFFPDGRGLGARGSDALGAQQGRDPRAGGLRAVFEPVARALLVDHDHRGIGLRVVVADRLDRHARRAANDLSATTTRQSGSFANPPFSIEFVPCGARG